MTLANLTKGERAMIERFEDISKSFQHRLYDVGISIGAEVQLVNILSFGQLFYLVIDEVELCIRQQDAKKIIVSKL